MKKVLLILITILSTISFSQTGTKNFIDQNFIEVTGNAKIEVIPNKIYLRIVINEYDFKGKKKLAEIERSMVKKFKEIGIDVSKNFTIKDMASNFKNYWLKKSTINSTKEYQLIINNAKTAGLVFRELELLGISNISIEKIENSDIQKFETNVKIKAIKNAKEKAKALTNAIDQKIGKAIFIREINNRVYRSNHPKSLLKSNIAIRGYSNELEVNQEPNIEFEKIKLEYSVLVRFEIE